MQRLFRLFIITGVRQFGASLPIRYEMRVDSSAMH